MKKVDVLAFGAHPDDVELSAAGTLSKMAAAGKVIGIADLTAGELGSRGSAPIRLREAEAAAKIMGVQYRENLGLADGFFEVNEANLLKVIESIRRYQPEVVLANAINDRHPDHGRGSDLVSRACFLSGLRRINTQSEGAEQKEWRPKVVYHYIQDYWIKPDFVVDITHYMKVKMASIQAYSSQFFDPNSKEPKTPISGHSFLDFIESRARHFGRPSGAEFGEGFTVERPPLAEDLTSIY